MARRVCVILPAFNEAPHIGALLEKIRAQNLNVVLIDDGSTDDTVRIASGLGAAVVSHGRNLGKGAAILNGFSYAREHGYELVITMDSDGQHDPAEIPLFLEAYERTGIPVLVGNRLWDKAKMPRIRRWTNQFMSRLLSRMMGMYVPDTQCGFRLYRTDVLPYGQAQSGRFATESEILLMLAQRGFRIDSVRISTIYRGQVSHINPLIDTVRFLVMLAGFYRARRRQP